MWLGSLPDNSHNNLKNIAEQELEVLLWISKSVGELIAATPSMASAITKQDLAKAFKAHINVVSSGNKAEFARQLQLPKNTVWLWCNGRNLPQLDTLVQICHRLNRSLIEFIT
ncbi:helix-turn-helix transcriptional regulator [Microcoleus sp. FACHB-1515]|uniref:helix-turn-helix domain-containing protein n=1 Tax=Cyanophyceae TaxID=3028117 RepID=UPI001F555029|nr:helix-turn-helix transcriptional regulator [Microcoleus sp. FACHB-1515]